MVHHLKIFLASKNTPFYMSIVIVAELYMKSRINQNKDENIEFRPKQEKNVFPCRF